MRHWNDIWRTDSHMIKSFVMLTGDCNIRTRCLKISTVLGVDVDDFPRVKVRTVISWYFSLLNVYCDFMISMFCLCLLTVYFIIIILMISLMIFILSHFLPLSISYLQIIYIYWSYMLT